MPLAQTMPLLCPVNNVVEGFPVRDVEYDDNTSTTELPDGTRPNIHRSTDSCLQCPGSWDGKL